MNWQLFILGNMNCDYFKDPPEPRTEKLKFLSSMYQLQQLISEPTRVTNRSATLIDLIFTNYSNNIAKSGVIYNVMSDHSITYIIYVIRTFIPNIRGQIKKEVRNLKHFVEEDFIHDLLQNINWETVETATDPNLAWKVWEISFNKVLDRHAPLRHQRIRQSSIPWLVIIIKKQFVKHNSEYHWRLYQTFRNKVNVEIRKSKSRYYCQKIGKCNKNDPKIPGN